MASLRLIPAEGNTQNRESELLAPMELDTIPAGSPKDSISPEVKERLVYKVGLAVEKVDEDSRQDRITQPKYDGKGSTSNPTNHL